MTPFYLNQYSHIPLMEGDHDQRHHLHPIVLPTDQTSFISYPIIFNPLQAQETDTNTDHHHPNQQVHHRHEVEFMDHLLIQGTSSFTNSSLDLSSSDDHRYTGVEDQLKPTKWMSSKMRIMRKMMSPDATPIKKPRRRKQAVFPGQQQKQQPQDAAAQASSSSNNNNSPSNGIVRVCSDCKTTKTPLWRSGPSGPKSLCNACGIRQRKARRAVAAAEAVRSGLIPAAEPSKVVKNKGSSDDADQTIPFKKRCRFNSAGSSGGAQKKKKMKKLGFDDIVVSLSKSSAFHRVSPQDEKEAAILLMALSCGLMCS